MSVAILVARMGPRSHQAFCNLQPGIRALSILLALCLWIGPGTGNGFAQSLAIPEPVLPELPSIDADEGFQIRGLVRPVARAELRTEIAAPVTKLPFREGEGFAMGDILVEFDCSRYIAELKAAEAAANAARVEFTSKKRLLAHKAVGKDEVLLAGARLDQNLAEVDIHKIVSARCSITAPFSGRIVSLTTSLHEYPKQNLPLMAILDDSRLEIELIAPSNWLTWLVPGSKFDFTIDETGRAITATVDRIGAEVDAVSQTIRLFAIFPVTDGNALAGMSGTATFSGGS